MRNDRYHTEWDAISSETGVPGLESAEDFTSRGAAGRSLVPFGQVGLVGNWPLWARQRDPCFSTCVDRSSGPAWALPVCLLVHAEAAVTPGPGQKGAAAGRLLNSTARALQVKTKAGHARGPVSLFSDTVVGRRYYKWRVGGRPDCGLILDAGPGARLELTWASWAGWAPGHHMHVPPGVAGSR